MAFVKRVPPPGKKLPISPIEFLASMVSLAEGIELDEKDPMKTVNSIVEKANEESIKRDVSFPRNEKPPDVRRSNMSPSGDMSFKFTSSMKFPDNILDELAEDERRRLSGEIDHHEGLKVELIYFPGLEDPINSDINLVWELKSITAEGIDISISFDNPLEVSQDVDADFALVQIEGFERFSDDKGAGLPDKILKKIAIPAQFATTEEAVTIRTTSRFGENTSKTVFASNFIVNLMLLTSINQLWGAVNSL